MKHAYAHLNESNHEQVIIDLSDEEDDERPLTRDEIRVKMLQALKKREASGDEKVDEKKVSDKKTMKKGTVPMGTSKTVSSKTLTKTNLGRGKENK